MEKYKEILDENPDIKKMLDDKLQEKKLEQKADLIVADLETNLDELKQVIAKYPNKIKKKEVRDLFKSVLDML